MAHHFGAVAEEDDPFDADVPVSLSQPQRTSEQSQQQSLRRAEEQPILEPHVQNMVKAHWRAVRYPAEPEHEENFDWDDFVRFREMCATNITEACLVVTPRWIIDHIGTVLESICAGPPIAWQDIDACIFVLTGVASRAPAGGDTVIPKLIELLPSLPYPTQGFKALLMRSAASRLVLFTSGYLASPKGSSACKMILNFLTTQHLPSIPPLVAIPDNPESKKYCEAIACDAMKMVMSSAREAIVQAENGTLWKDLVSAVISLVADARFHVDCRAQLIFGIGQVLSSLSDWGELERMLGLFVKRMEEPVLPILSRLPAEPLGPAAVKATRDGKAPSELKLYIAAVSSVYNMPVTRLSRTHDHHPVLAVVEQNFATIEKICLHHTQYDELMEQVCLAFSYILGFAREYAPASPVFVPMLKLMARCCEQHPQPFYLGVVKSVIGFFATACDEQVDAVLIDLTELFVVPVASRLGSPNALSPPINTASYEILSECVRHWNLAMLGMTSAQWMADTLEKTIDALPLLAAEGLVHERTICAMLRFIRTALLWADPDLQKGGHVQELATLCTQAQRLFAERQMARGTLLPRVILALTQLMAAAARDSPTKGDVLPSVAEVLRCLLAGPFEFAACSQLPGNLRSQLPGVFQEPELQRLIQQLKMEKADSRRFVRTVIGVVEQFSVILKKAQFR
uniref:Exportin-1/Importin-beta-like domain-containing protein n=1 Tax=Noctiluca scintillans TaxID=2966 RepID=A0A7S1AFD0_NOCSC